MTDFLRDLGAGLRIAAGGMSSEVYQAQNAQDEAALKRQDAQRLAMREQRDAKAAALLHAVQSMSISQDDYRKGMAAIGMEPMVGAGPNQTALTAQQQAATNKSLEEDRVAQLAAARKAEEQSGYLRRGLSGVNALGAAVGTSVPDASGKMVPITAADVQMAGEDINLNFGDTKMVEQQAARFAQQKPEPESEFIRAVKLKHGSLDTPGAKADIAAWVARKKAPAASGAGSTPKLGSMNQFWARQAKELAPITKSQETGRELEGLIASGDPNATPQIQKLLTDYVGHMRMTNHLYADNKSFGNMYQRTANAISRFASGDYSTENKKLILDLVKKMDSTVFEPARKNVVAKNTKRLKALGLSDELAKDMADDPNAYAGIEMNPPSEGTQSGAVSEVDQSNPLLR